MLSDVTTLAQSQVNLANQAINGVAEALIASAHTQADELSDFILEYPAVVLSLTSAKISEKCGDSLGKSMKLNLSVPLSEVQILLTTAKAQAPQSLKSAEPQPLLEAAP